MPPAERILVTGAAGQVGSELVPYLRERHGPENVVATDLNPLPEALARAGPHLRVDCRDPAAVEDAVRRHDARVVYHLAAILSAAGEEAPRRAFQVNLEGLVYVLDAARGAGASVFVPSSIAVFGPSSPRDPAPQEGALRPTSMYGITKLSGELLCDYYHLRFGVDVRGLRFPGIISHVTRPGRGTTDFAVEIFYGAVEEGRYTCYLEPDTRMDFLYISDALEGAVALMAADGDGLRYRNAYNVTSFQATPEELARAIRAHVPEFEVDYEVDPVRQALADTWPRRLDDGPARADWGWRPRYDLESVVEEMLQRIRARTNPEERRVDAS